jgi:hypothetical protein
MTAIKATANLFWIALSTGRRRAWWCQGHGGLVDNEHVAAGAAGFVGDIAISWLV